jgi:hypothetical protein
VNDPVSEIRARIEALQDELKSIPAAPWAAQKIADRKRGIAILTDQLERVERVHQRFLEGRAELLVRLERFATMPNAR